MTPGPFEVVGIIRPRPDRCDGSLQRAMLDDRDSACPVCGRRVQVIRLDSQAVLVEHQPGRSEALPLEMFG